MTDLPNPDAGSPQPEQIVQPTLPEADVSRRIDVQMGDAGPEEEVSTTTTELGQTTTTSTRPEVTSPAPTVIHGPGAGGEPSNNPDNDMPHNEVPATGYGSTTTVSGQTTTSNNPESNEQTSYDPDEGRIKDHDKAEDMAYAGKLSRENAARVRGNVESRRDLLRRIDSSNKNRDDWRKLREEINKNYYDPHLYHDILDGLEGDTTRREIEANLQLLEREEKSHDREADRVENWAAILYDHPISEAYKAAHANYTFEPSQLRTREYELDRKRFEIDQLEKEIRVKNNLLGVEGLPIHREIDTRPQFVAQKAYGLNPYDYMVRKEDGETTEQMGLTVEQADKLDEYLKLVGSPDTTLGQLRDFYVEAFRIAYIDPRKQILEADTKVLDDVRSGRASETPPTPN